MTQDQLELWKLIEDFEIDDPDSHFMFTDRLARENSWSTQYSVRAVIEYKKFIFMICVSRKALTPSDEVDQVWHLHLLYTRSYWVELCRDILNQEIHHGPTTGMVDRNKFVEQYEFTLKLYQELFDEAPPKDIWPSSEIRFKSVHFSRVNRDDNWILPKPKFRR